MTLYIENFLEKKLTINYICCAIGVTGRKENVMQTVNFDELFETSATIEEIPFYILKKDYRGYIHVYAFDHASLTNGYVRKNAKCNPIPYSGNFGSGYTINIHNPNSTRYALKAYYISKFHNTICKSNDNCTLCPLYTIENEEHCLY